MKYRIEKDTLGEVQVPEEKLWGAQTQRSKTNFKIGNLSVQTRLMKEEKPMHTFSPYEIGYRIIYKNKSLVYCGDNDIASRDDIIRLAKGCDLLIIDSALIKPSKGHLTS